MKQESTVKKPRYLFLDPVAKKEAIADLEHCSPEHKQIFKECALFTEDLERLLKDPKINLKAIKKLFELRAAALKKALLAR